MKAKLIQSSRRRQPAPFSQSGLTSAATIIISCFILHSAFGQGSLTPPGPPGPTMKSLGDVEPRTGISSLPITITQGGSYYLAQSFAQAFTTNAITIATNNVTLDLGGFTIMQTGASSVTGILVKATAANTLVKNALIKHGSIIGFADGVNCAGARYCLLEYLTVNEGGNGIAFQASGSAVSTGNIVRHCRTCGNSGTGIAFLADAANVRNAMEDCDSFDNSYGFSLASSDNLIIHCRASNSTNCNYSIAASNDMGTTAEPIQNNNSVCGAKGGSFGIGVTDPFSNLSYP